MIRTTLVGVFAALFAGHALAALPDGAVVRQDHPHLYASAAQFAQLKLDATVGPGALPEKGELRIAITPAAKGVNDKANTVIFGDQDRPNSIWIRHVDSGDTSNSARLQLYMTYAKDKHAFGASFDVPAGQRTELVLQYDAVAQTAKLIVGGGPGLGAWQSAGNGWRPGGQRFIFDARASDVIADVAVVAKDAMNQATVVWQSPLGVPIDTGLNRAWVAYRERAERTIVTVEGCDPLLATDTADVICNTAQAGRDKITEPAKWLALAYRLTGDEKFLLAARKHLARILAAGPGWGPTGSPEWSQGARVGALGIYYDWLYDELQSDATTLADIRSKIRETVKFNDSSTSADLIGSMCGIQDWSPSEFDCAIKPVFTGWTGTGPSILASYLSGHTASANTGSALGLLAIASEDDSVLPALETIYDHFKLGYLPARDYYSGNGGNHSLYAYAVAGGETADRLVMWERAFQWPGDGSGLQTLAAAHMIYPYIYGMRGDGTFPARGDDFRFANSAPGVGRMALAAVNAACPPESDDGALPCAADNAQHAANFYWNHVYTARASDPSSMLEERLLYPKPPAAAVVGALPLSRHFEVAGNVLMRDTWVNADATLLEFKSTSFISLNHHHMDQNSYSLYYRAPLLLDSGQYDKYGSNHWHNYYVRSIAHNTITAYDAAEEFDLPTTAPLANDGGHWLGERTVSPRIDQIKPKPVGVPAAADAGSHVLDGVTAFESGAAYSYVAGNASKAYAPGKLDPAAGFLRSIVYLRDSTSGTLPKVLVFDLVRPTKSNLEISSILHSVSRPASTTALTHIANEAGRYRFAADDLTQPVTIRNGAGMVTVQTLLPAGGRMVVAGGKGEGASCTQANDPFFNKPTSDLTDCRFLVRRHGTGDWANFPPLVTGDAANLEDTRSTDIGAWRLEITPATPPAIGATQYFLNVLHVDDVDSGSGAAQIAAATLLSAEDNTVAVALASGRTVVFNGAAEPASTLTWTPASGSSSSTLIVGLLPNRSYTVEAVGTTGKRRVTLSVGGRQSSDAGVLELVSR